MKEKHIINWFILSTPNESYYIYNTNETIVSFNTLNRFYFHSSFDFNLNVFIFFFNHKSLNKPITWNYSNNWCAFHSIFSINCFSPELNYG